MNNIFFGDERRRFTWNDLGDIDLGRGALGGEMPVVLYRLMQYTLIDVISEELGQEKANEFVRSAGRLAGEEFAKNILNLTLGFDDFLAHLQEQLKLLKVGILRMEEFDTESGEIVLTVEEDLDCSGLPVTGETVCVYDEGFLDGILFSYTGKRYNVKEIDCWATGDRVCRFRGALAE